MHTNTLFRALAIIALSFVIGAVNKYVNANAPNWVGYYPVSSDADTAKIPEAAGEDDPKYLSIGEAADLYNTPGVIFVDARDEWDYNEGHIKGAVNVPFEGDEQIYLDFVTATPNEQIVVVYCNGAECDLSLYLGRNLEYDGFTNVNIFFGGWSDWKLKELPSEKSAVVESSESTETERESDDAQDTG